MSCPCTMGECMCRPDIEKVLDLSPGAFADAVAYHAHTGKWPSGLCVEKSDKCQRGDDCRCRRDADAEPGW